MRFVTHCPSCGTSFKVVADQLRIAQGWVRCGHCQAVYKAYDTLTMAQEDEAEEKAAQAVAENKTRVHEPETAPEPAATESASSNATPVEPLPPIKTEITDTVTAQDKTVVHGDEKAPPSEAPSVHLEASPTTQAPPETPWRNSLERIAAVIAAKKEAAAKAAEAKADADAAVPDAVVEEVTASASPAVAPLEDQALVEPTAPLAMATPVEPDEPKAVPLAVAEDAEQADAVVAEAISEEAADAAKDALPVLPPIIEAEQPVANTTPEKENPPEESSEEPPAAPQDVQAPPTPQAPTSAETKTRDEAPEIPVFAPEESTPLVLASLPAPFQSQALPPAPLASELASSHATSEKPTPVAVERTRTAEPPIATPVQAQTTESEKSQELLESPKEKDTTDAATSAASSRHRREEDETLTPEERAARRAERRKKHSSKRRASSSSSSSSSEKKSDRRSGRKSSREAEPEEPPAKTPMWAGWFARKQEEAAPDETEEAAAEALTAASDEAEDAPPAETDLTFMVQAQRRAFWRQPKVRAGLLVGIIVGLLTLGGQMLFYWRSPLYAQVPITRVVLEPLCQQMGCTIPPWRNIASVSIDSSNFRRLANGSYRFNISLRNTNIHPVAMPAMELVVLNADEQVLFKRVIQNDPALPAPPFLPPRGEWEGVATVDVKLPREMRPQDIAGYRVAVFYP